jgi:hypothetical protein
MVALRAPKQANMQAAADALGRLGPAQREPAIPVVLELLEKTKLDMPIHQSLLNLLSPHMGKHGPRILKLLRRFLEKKDSWVPLQAITLLSEIGPAARELLPDLIRRIDHVFSYHAHSSVFQSVDPQGFVVIPLAIERLASSKREIRAAALHWLLGYGPSAKNASAALNRLVSNEKEEWMRSLAEATLAAIGGS